MTSRELAQRLAAEALAAGDPTGWFEALYSAADENDSVPPWDRRAPREPLRQWALRREVAGAGRRALVVGCGLGADAEYIAGLGFSTVAFDISATAIRIARERFPGSEVGYLTADLLQPPGDWDAAFDLVVESLTVQSLPDPPRAQAIRNIGRMVAAGGTLVVVASARDEDSDPPQGPPWPLTRSEIESFAVAGLEPVRIHELGHPEQPSDRYWQAEFRRPDPRR